MWYVVLLTRVDRQLGQSKDVYLYNKYFYLIESPIYWLIVRDYHLLYYLWGITIEDDQEIPQ